MQIKLKEHTGWKSFVSLAWYDGLIEFIFRFVAKTSEPLLAVGLVISAVDVLTKGRLMSDNIALSYGWAWAQSIAIESSGGVVLVYGLQSFKDRDKVKAWAYIVLAALLAIVGGMMLYSQLLSSATGAQDAFSGGGWLTQVLVILRVIVSVTYVVLCRTKHIKFNNLLTDTLTLAGVNTTQVTTSEETESKQDERLEKMLQAMQAMNQQNLQAMQTMSQQVLTVTVEQFTRVTIDAVRQAVECLPQPATLPQLPEGNTDQETGVNVSEPPTEPNGGKQNYGPQIEALYTLNPHITTTEIERQLGCTRKTAAKHLERLRPVMVENEEG